MPKKFLYFFPENDSLFETPVKVLFIQHRVDWTSFKNAKHYLQFWAVRIVIVSHILLHSLCVLRAPGKEEGNTNDTNKSCIRESVNHHQLRTKGKKKHDYCPTQTKLCFLLLPLIFRWFLERLTVSLSLSYDRRIILSAATFIFIARQENQERMQEKKVHYSCLT